MAEHALPTPLVSLLAEWQREAREMLPPLREAADHPDGVMPLPRLQAREAGVRRLRQVMMPRETRKQRHLWPVVRSHVVGGDEAVDELVGRKREFEDNLLKLRWGDERSRAMDEQLASVVDTVRGFIACEDRLMPRLAAEIPREIQDRVAMRLDSRRRLEPTQPHPDAPGHPWAAVVFAPILAISDRVRDLVSTAPG